jgi:hypothetical protein
MATYDETGTEVDEADASDGSGSEEEAPEVVEEPPKRSAKKTRRVGKLPARGIAAQPATPSPDTTPTNEPWPADGEQLWDAIAAATDRGALVTYGAARAADWKIDVTRTGLGPMPSPAVKMQSIDGAAVGGSEQRTPGEMLYDYLAELYHPLAPGMAKYDLQFVIKRRGAFKRGAIELPAPAELAQQRARVAQHAQTTSLGALGQPGGVPMPPRTNWPTGVGATPQQAMSYPQQQQPGYYPAPQDNGTRDSVDAMRREVAMLMGRIDEATRQAAAQPIGVGSAAPTPAPLPEDLETRIAKVVLTTLGALGIGPAQRQAPSDPPPPPVAPIGFGAPTQGIGTVVETARNHMSGLKEILGIMKEFRELDQGFAGKPPEDDAAEEREENPVPAVPAVIEDAAAFKVRAIPFSETPLNGGKQILWVERIDGESTTEWLTRMGAANPDAALNILKTGMHMLDQMSIGQLVKQWMERGGSMGQAAQVVAAQANGAGVGAAPAQADGDIYPPA